MPTKIRGSPKYVRFLTTPVTETLHAAVATAASAHLMSGTSYVRAALLAKLRADGFEVEKKGAGVVATATR